MNGQNDHPHITFIPFTPLQQQTATAANQSSPIPFDVDDSQTTTATMPTLEEMQNLAAAQAEQLQRANDMLMQQQQQMADAQATFDAQAQQLRDSAEQLRQQQNTINQLSNAFSTLTTATAPATAPRKKPEMPPFDQQNVLIWLKRLTAAYDRAGVTRAKDKFSYLESVFDISFNPVINNFLFESNNSDEDWTNFITYMKTEYGPTTRQKARKLIGELPRNNMKPSQYMAQLEDETRDVTLDDIKKEHLLKTIPPRIREILGKQVEKKTAAEVAKLADEYFDSQGRPLEKSATSINNVLDSHSNTPARQQSHFTTAFEDDDAEVNFVKKNNNKFTRQRSRSRPRFGNNNNNSSASSSSSSSSSASAPAARQQQQSNSNNLCRFHRMFGDNATRCISNCSQHGAFMKKHPQQSGNDKGGRRQ